jgi:hypothetical protein
MKDPSNIRKYLTWTMDKKFRDFLEKIVNCLFHLRLDISFKLCFYFLIIIMKFHNYVIWI